LLDQIAFFLRVGADSFSVPGNWSASDIEKSEGLFSNVYQPAADQRPTISELRRGQYAAAAAE